MNSAQNNDNSYVNYIQNLIPSVSNETLDKISHILDQTSWDEPNNTADWNNIAVVAMTEAEQTQDITMRSMYLEIAFDALNNGLEIDKHPILSAHIALIHSWLGEKARALEIAFNTFINSIHYAYTLSAEKPHYLIFLSTKNQKLAINDQKIIEKIFLSDNIYDQALFLLSEIISKSQIAFYTSVSERFLYLANQTLPNLVNLSLKLGIGNLMGGKVEGILYLQQARKLQPDYSQCSNIKVAQYLESISYQLFYYQPFIQKLIPVNSPENYQQLNCIALHPERLSMFDFCVEDK